MAKLRREKRDEQRELQKKWPSSQSGYQSKPKEYENTENGYERYKREKDAMWRVRKNARNRIRRSVKKENSTTAYLGCSWHELKNHLESLFKDGMSWDNYGTNGWHIDHIIPLASAKNEEEIIPLLHYTNLQPLWAGDNIRKGARF